MYHFPLYCFQQNKETGEIEQCSPVSYSTNGQCAWPTHFSGAVNTSVSPQRATTDHLAAVTVPSFSLLLALKPESEDYHEQLIDYNDKITMNKFCHPLASMLTARGNEEEDDNDNFIFGKAG